MSLNMHVTSTVAHMKHKLGQKCNILTCQQRLSFKDVVLDDHLTLAECGIADNDIVIAEIGRGQRLFSKQGPFDSVC